MNRRIEQREKKRGKKKEKHDKPYENDNKYKQGVFYKNVVLVLNNFIHFFLNHNTNKYF